jgi:hypothetical protein
MNSLIKKSRRAPISKTDPLALLLRNCCFFWEERKLSHAEWVENHKPSVMAAGRVLQFLDLAEAAERSGIGWTAKPIVFQMAKDAEPALDAEPQDYNSDEFETTKEESVMVDMLDGIATAVLFDNKLSTSQYSFGSWPEFFQQREIVLHFTHRVLLGTGLMRSTEEGYQPSPLLCELFTQGATKIGNAARTSSLVKREFLFKQQFGSLAEESSVPQ